MIFSFVRSFNFSHLDELSLQIVKDSGFCNVEELIIVHKPFGVFLSDILHDVGKGETCLAC